MARPKLKTKTEKEAVLAEVAKLDRRGHTQHEIRKLLASTLGVKVGQPMVSIYLKEIRTNYVRIQTEQRAELVAEKVEQYREVRREAWAAWERSKRNSVRRVKESSPPPPQRDEKLPGVRGFKRKDAAEPAESLRLLKQIVTQEGRLPANEYLATVMRTLEAECKLLGLEPETVNQQQVNIFTDLRKLLEPSEVVDPMADVLAAKGLVVPAIEGGSQ